VLAERIKGGANGQGVASTVGDAPPAKSKSKRQMPKAKGRAKAPAKNAAKNAAKKKKVAAK
jgi:hypothetical protein